MKVFAVPTVTAGATAGLSMLFFLALNHVVGEKMLAHIVIVQAAVAIVQIVVVPNTWMVLIGSTNDRLSATYSAGQSIEWIAGLATITIITLAQGAVGEASAGASAMSLSLLISGSNSLLGFFRAREDWFRYVLWTLIPNAMRLPFVLATPWLVREGWLSDPASDPGKIIYLYFLLPDLVRFAVILLPHAIKNFVVPSIEILVSTARLTLKNWLYEIGSASIDQGDKLIVGSLLGPQVLVAYYFARRLGIVSVMVIEPMYWEYFRRFQTGTGEAMSKTWRRGLGFSLLIWASAALGAFVLSRIPLIAAFLPTAILSLFGLFIGVLLADCMNGVNRWARYIAQLSKYSLVLLGVRWTAFASFVLTIILVKDAMPTGSVLVGMASAVLIETMFILFLLKKAPRS